MTTLDDQITEMQNRVLNAKTIRAAAKLHDQLDALRDRAGKPPTLPRTVVQKAPPKTDEYKAGYDAGYHAGRRARA